MAKTRIGGTKMWWLPPNYLLFRYPVWPPKTGFLGFLGKPLFWGDRQTGDSGAESGTVLPNPGAQRTRKRGFVNPGNTGFFGFPEKPRILRNSSMIETAKISEANGGGNFDRKFNRDVPFRLRRIMNLDS